MPLDWYFRTALRDVSTSSVGPAMRVACYAYLTMSAALRPAPATTMVCGEPFFLGALLRLWGSLVNFSRKAGRFARVLGSCHEVVSCMELAMASQSPSRRRTSRRNRLTGNVQVGQLDGAQVRAESCGLLREVVGRELGVHESNAYIEAKLGV